MDAGSVAATGGTFVTLSENEQRYYSGLHALCRADSSGKLSAAKVAELFRASQLPTEALHQPALCPFQVTEVCGAKRLGYFASGQFYVALKLLSAAQAGLPVCLDSTSGELPLPMFVGINSEGEGLNPNLNPATGSAPRPTADRPTLKHADPSTDAQAVSVEGPVEHSDDPWRMTAEQQDYYTHQFHSLQPDLGGLILGAVAKNFFTKSKLPIPELSHIWELSDEDRDGALSFPEFCTAFHLVVARKNGYPLPECLPPTLVAASRGQSLPLPAQEMGVVSQQEAKESMPQQDLPQELELNVKSRARPRSYSSTSIDDAMKKVEDPPTPPPRPHKTHSRASSLDLNKLLQQSSQGVKSLTHPPALPPRPPVSQMTHFLPDKNSQQTLQQHCFADFSKLREEVRKIHTHTHTHPQTLLPCGKEEAGVALETLRSQDPGAPKTDSTVPSHNHVPQKPVRRKLHPEGQNATPPLGSAYSSPAPATVSKPTQRLRPRLPARQKREIQTAIRKNRETNAVLTRLNSELQQQLKTLVKESEKKRERGREGVRKREGEKEKERERGRESERKRKGEGVGKRGREGERAREEERKRERRRTRRRDGGRKRERESEKKRGREKEREKARESEKRRDGGRKRERAGE
ncbi:hypothetical protein P4O66_020778 [Electrophorus voltai]|uniref:RALBP1 associated Eps domain containing 2 n=1 Tax=Electrophorus voltai TaxID=2609070 RepID=A0AAD9E6D3_9TELE|nr:hypothetical protein P4O66_020778 [Electrophorus voltai]